MADFGMADFFCAEPIIINRKIEGHSLHAKTYD